MRVKLLQLQPWIAALLASSPAMGLQPLEVFIAAAREQNPDAQRARANLAEQSAQADVALGKRFPGFRSRQTT
jgi:outer membrane protein TolC